MLRKALFASFLVLAAACSATEAESNDVGVDESQFRELSESEALSDLDALGMNLRANYGPLEYKKARYGFDLDTELGIARRNVSAAHSEGDRIRPFYELLAKLRDGHVGLSFPVRASSTSESTFGVGITPIGAHYYVSTGSPVPASADGGAPPPSTTRPRSWLVRGDRIVAIDGISAERLEELLLPLCEIGTLESSRHRVAMHMVRRPFYAGKELQPKGTHANIVAERVTGERFAVSLPWTTVRGGAAGLVASAPPPTAQSPVDDTSLHLEAMVENAQLDIGREQSGASTPWFLNAVSRQLLGATDVYPQVATLVKHGFHPNMPAVAELPIQFRAYQYTFEGKNILLVRIPTFSVRGGNYDDHLSWLTALLEDTKAAGKTYAVVVDVSHNPGGAVPFVQGLVSLFTPRPIPNQVAAQRANRHYIQGLIGNANMSQDDNERRAIWLERVKLTEDANDRGDLLSPFMPMSGTFLGLNVPQKGAASAGGNFIPPHPVIHWDGPLLVLHDELSGSGGDAFPQLLQNGGVAKTFGARTAAMGGSRADFTLPISAGRLSLTMGLFGPYEADGKTPDLIENNGVVPDYPHEVTFADFQKGYVDYVTAFSRAAVGLVR